MDALITDLLRRIRDLSAYIDAQEDLPPAQYLALLKLQGELTSRASRLLRERAQGAGKAGADLEQAIQEALDAAAAALRAER